MCKFGVTCVSLSFQASVTVTGEAVFSRQRKAFADIVIRWRARSSCLSHFSIITVEIWIVNESEFVGYLMFATLPKSSATDWLPGNMYKKLKFAFLVVESVPFKERCAHLKRYLVLAQICTVRSFAQMHLHLTNSFDRDGADPNSAARISSLGSDFEINGVYWARQRKLWLIAYLRSILQLVGEANCMHWKSNCKIFYNLTPRWFRTKTITCKPKIISEGNWKFPKNVTFPFGAEHHCFGDYVTSSITQNIKWLGRFRKRFRIH